MAVLGEKEWREHAQLVGSVTLAWNRAVHQLLRVFTHLTGIESPVAEAIFFAAQSDSAQRYLIKRVAVAVDLQDPHLAALKNLLSRLEKVSTGRNLAAHVIFGVSAFDPESGAWGPKVVPALSPAQDTRLRADFARQFGEAEETLGAIVGDLESWLVHTPFPERPWEGPAMPIAAAQQIARQLAEIEVPQSFSSPG